MKWKKRVHERAWSNTIFQPLELLIRHRKNRRYSSLIALIFDFLWYKFMNDEKKNRHYHVFAQFLYKIHEFYNFVVNNFLHVVSFIFFVFSFFVVFNCTLETFVVFIMKKISSKTRLNFFVCVFVVDFTTLFLLRCRFIRLSSQFVLLS